MDIGDALRYYKRADVQKAIAELAKEREVAVRYGEQFGKRPDMISFPKDVIEFVKNGTTSFHCSEERWDNPLNLGPDMAQKQLDSMRIGWDLVIDIDCKIWKYSKLVTLLVVSMLKKYNVSAVTVKFSGNKGFHIAVPFESFPEKFNGVNMAMLFPDAPRKIANYIAHTLEKKMAELLKEEDKKEISEFLNENVDKIFTPICKKCRKQVRMGGSGIEFICANCGNKIISEKDAPYQICDKCGKIMEKIEENKKIACSHCGSIEFEEKFDIKKIVEIDTVLIAPRHLFRMAYSLHEKSGLASVPIELNKIRNFKKEDAMPEKVIIKDLKFLDRSKAVRGEMNSLLLQAYDYDAKEETEEEKKIMREFELPSVPIKMDIFPPCMKLIANGLEDGRKRSIFILLNFLSTMGWPKNDVENFIKEWNQKNKPPLKEGTLSSAIRAHMKGKQIAPPPNCDRGGYYKDFGVCRPDGICQRIKNPVMYYKFRQKIEKKKGGRRSKVFERKVNS